VKGPIYTAERRHQKYVLDANRSGTLWIWVAVMMLVPALVTALVILALTLTGSEIHEIPPETDLHRAIQSVFNAAAILLIAMNIAQSLVVTMVASGLAAESVGREHRHHTWDLLILTRQPARSIARGKILAVFWTLRRDLGFVVILRMGLLAMVYELSRQINQAIGLAPLHQGHLVILLALTLLWTVIDSFMAVGTAVAAASWLRFRGIALFVAFSLRVLVLAFGVMWLMLVCNTMAAVPNRPSFAILGAIGLLVFSLMAYLSVLIAEMTIRGAGASAYISQPISQTPPSSPSMPENIPNLSQTHESGTVKG